MDAIEAMIKALGAAGGSFLALVYLPPKTRRDFALRLSFAFLSGLLFADPVRIEYLHWPETWQMWLASSALVSLVSWWVFAAVTRVLGKWSPK